MTIGNNFIAGEHPNFPRTSQRVRARCLPRLHKTRINFVFRIRKHHQCLNRTLEVSKKHCYFLTVDYFLITKKKSAESKALKPPKGNDHDSKHSQLPVHSAQHPDLSNQPFLLSLSLGTHQRRNNLRGSQTRHKITHAYLKVSQLAKMLEAPPKRKVLALAQS